MVSTLHYKPPFMCIMIIYLFVYLYACVCVGVHAMVHMFRPEDNLWE